MGHDLVPIRFVRDFHTFDGLNFPKNSAYLVDPGTADVLFLSGIAVDNANRTAWRARLARYGARRELTVAPRIVD